MSNNMPNRDTLINKLSSCTARTDIPYGSSAVIIPLIEISEELHIIFEERSHTLSFQPGDICFPGGKIEGLESPKEAAIRECLEELYPDDQNPANLDIIADLPPIMGPKGHIVYPFVAFLNNYSFTYSKAEVHKVIHYPLSFFESHPGLSYPMEKVTKIPSDFPYELIPGGSSYKFHIQKYDMWFYKETSPVVWGFTGRLLHSFLKIISYPDA